MNMPPGFQLVYKTTVHLTIAIMLVSCKPQEPEPARDGFNPGQVWLDTDGKPIEAHGGGILKTDSFYFWYGENHALGSGNKTGISCYRSSDLVHWINQGVVLPKDSLPEEYRDSGVCERPKVLYNSRTGKYVMWMHLDGRNYSLARAGIAISDKPSGPFTMVRIFRPISFAYSSGKSVLTGTDPLESKDGNTFRDMNLFLDEDGSAWVFYASENNATMYVAKLSKDFTDVEKPLIKGKNWERILINGNRESPVPFKYQGKYYLITSGTTGWEPNAAMVHQANKLTGPWKSLGNPCLGSGASTTFNSQGTFVIAAPNGMPGDFIWMADRWNGSDLSKSTMVWLPFRMKKNGAFHLEYFEWWNLSAFDCPHKRLKAPDIRLAKIETDSSETFVLHWKAIQGAIGYRIRKNSLYLDITTSTQYILPQELAGSECLYSVCAINLDTVSRKSNTIEVFDRQAFDIWLSDVEPAHWKQGYGSLGKDHSVSGGRLSIAGKTYPKGLGTHAVSEIIYYPQARYRHFEAYAGVDDFPGFSDSPSVVFKVFCDGKLTWQSGLMKVKEEAQKVEIDLSGVKELKLVVEDGGDGTHYDHADWAGARLIANP